MDLKAKRVVPIRWYRFTADMRVQNEQKIYDPTKEYFFLRRKKKTENEANSSSLHCLLLKAEHLKESTQTEENTKGIRNPLTTALFDSQYGKEDQKIGLLWTILEKTMMWFYKSRSA